jgi:hypothetical protein
VELRLIDVAPSNEFAFPRLWAQEM